MQHFITGKIEERIKEYFFLYPWRRFHIRELGKLAQANNRTVIRHLKLLLKQDLIRRYERKGHYPYYQARWAFSIL